MASKPEPDNLVITKVVNETTFETHLPSLAKLLQHCVNDDPPSSSIGFLAPLSDEHATEHWQALLPSCTGPKPQATTLFVATTP